MERKCGSTEKENMRTNKNRRCIDHVSTTKINNAMPCIVHYDPPPTSAACSPTHHPLSLLVDLLAETVQLSCSAVQISFHISPSPSPSPNSSVDLGPSRVNNSVSPALGSVSYGLSNENCTSSLRKCPRENQIHMTACLFSSSNGIDSDVLSMFEDNMILKAITKIIVSNIIIKLCISVKNLGGSLVSFFMGSYLGISIEVKKVHLTVLSFEMDRDWMSANRLTVKYREGVDFFLEFSAKNADNPDLVHCPCLKCGNMERMKIAQIREHLFKNGIDRSYKFYLPIKLLGSE
ncbi:hypothetical protein G4B88_000797 [Cannabis sativa]|uniref:Transposase-associated domain-containing protein n=1 Tax=Cannabis sativa TaxID=3483 RepID=A0A7J6I3Y6_CANSA|nr:hypothetical protein G4B88_000797 [Cannabis sativa]